MQTEIDLAWAAGFIDGEGCLTIGKTKNRFGKPIYTAWLIVVNTHHETVQRLVALFACGSIHKQDKGGGNRKPSYAWRCSTRDAERVVRLVRPYLVTKANDADVLLEFASLKRNTHNQFGDFATVQVQRETMYQKLGENRAGGRRKASKSA